MTEAKLLSLLVPAVGGQGGGVLSEWIVEAASFAGLLAHGTSIPGVAQRTGSTTYYVEVFTGAADDPPAFSLYPIPGALDVLLAPELLEVGRMIELGFPSPSRTTIIASTQRLYSIHEKVTTGGNLYPAERLAEAARQFSRRLVAFDALALAREHGTEANAILLGALAGTGALPIPPEAYRAAIEAKGIQVEANVRGFELGLARATVAEARSAGGDAAALMASGGTPADDSLVAALPASVRDVVRLAIPRLVDYQDRAYAARYVERLRPFAKDGADPELARRVARHLAVWMTYEDAIRVADLKTRAARFERIRREVPSRGEVVVTDYLKPDLDEIYGILPHALVAPLARWAERRWPHARPTLGQHVKTTTISGYLRLWVLARCRWLRPASYRARHEHERMERWLVAVAKAAGQNIELAREVAEAAALVKGYGDVRRRMCAVIDDFLSAIDRAASLAAARGDVGVATALARRYRELVRQGPEGEIEAARMAEDVVARLERDAVAEARGAVSGRG